jgi:hypothetical protein
MTASHEWQHPEETVSNLGPIDGVEIVDFGDITESTRIFDTARDEMYLQATRIILGGGGDSRDEAMEALSHLRSHAVRQFSTVAAQLFANDTLSSDAISALATLYYNDQERRFEILQKAVTETGSEEKVDFEFCDKTDVTGMIADVLNDISEELEEEATKETVDATDEETVDQSARYSSHYAEFYDNTITLDLETALNYAMPNKSELHAIDQAMRRDRFMRTLTNLGMMAGTSALTVLGMVVVDKHRK